MPQYIRSQVAWNIKQGNPTNISLDSIQTHNLNNPLEIEEYVKLFKDVKPANVDSITDDELDVIERATYHSIELTTFDDLTIGDCYVLSSNVSKNLKEILKETDETFKKLCEEREQLETEIENRKIGFIKYLRSIKDSKEVMFDDPVHTQWLRERSGRSLPKHIKPEGALLIKNENNIPSFWVTDWNGKLTFTQEKFNKFVENVKKDDSSKTDDLYKKFKYFDGVGMDITDSIRWVDNQIMHMEENFRKSIIIANRDLQKLFEPKILIVKIRSKNDNTIELNAYKINGDAFFEWRDITKFGGKQAQLQTFELTDKYFKLFECYSLKRIVSLKKTEDLVRELHYIKKGAGTNKTPNTKRIKSNNRKYMSRSGRRVYRTRTNYRKKTVRQRRRR